MRKAAPISQQSSPSHGQHTTDAEYLDALAHLYRLFANAYMVTSSRPDGADLVEEFLASCEAVHGIDTATAPEAVKDAATDRITRAASALASAAHAGELKVVSSYAPALGAPQ